MSYIKHKNFQKKLFLICLLTISFYFICFMGHVCVIANHKAPYNDNLKKKLGV